MALIQISEQRKESIFRVGKMRINMSRKYIRKYNHAVSRLCKERLYINTNMCITDNTHLEIECCKRIIEYNDVYIKLKTITMTVIIWGKNLRISDYNTDGIIIDGVFSSVEFE